MEKENLDNFLENRQSYMMDNNSMQQLNVASAVDGVVGGVPAEVVSGVTGEILGGKYDEHHEEHDVGDDDELKYVEEVQQSEKQQQQQLQMLKNIGLDDDGIYKSNELAVKETNYNAANEFGNGNGGFVFGGDHQNFKQQQQGNLFSMGNGHGTNGHDIANINEDFSNLISVGFEEKVNMMESDLDGFKNDGDFSNISNVTESAEGYVPQIDVEIETKVGQQEIVDEEEPSSLATNTTNGTSSLSENVPPQAAFDAQSNSFDNFVASMEKKENSDPLISKRPNELDLEQAHSQLNPDAKEFIPNFGSNPASPTSPFAAGMQQNEPVLSEIMETEMYFGQAPSAVPHHVLGEDDFVAQSPRKGKDADSNMDAVLLPTELAEFEQEADKRPHELETESIDGFNQRDEVMTPDQAIQQLPLDKENQPPSDSTDFQASNFMDHGPETCVDLETDLDLQPSAVLSSAQDEDDVMKRSIYVANDDEIEDVLNSVQPIPTEIDSLNASFEGSATETDVNHLVVDKELLQVEEKEHVSHSPSTEELQMNLLSALNFSNKDLTQLPSDMDNADNMQESMYIEQHPHVEQDQEGENQLQVEKQFDQGEILENHQQQQMEEPLQYEQHFEQEHQSEVEPEDLDEQRESQEEMQNIQEEFPSAKQQEGQQFSVEEEKLEKHIEEQYEEQEMPEKLPLESQLLHDQYLTEDPMEDTLLTEVTDNSVIADTTNSLIANESFLDNALETHELQQELNESFSPFKISDEMSSTHAIESLNVDTLAINQQEPSLNNDVMTPSYTADEKHLFEETKEQQLFSVSGLEQQMSEIALNTDDNLSQAEEVSATVATAAVEDKSNNLIGPDGDAAQEETYQHHQDQKRTHEQMLVDDSFNQHELECEKQYQQELQNEHQDETKLDLVNECIESPIEQQHQQELESELVAIAEPVMEARQAEPLFTNVETETVNIIKTEERQELPPFMAPEEAPAGLLEPLNDTRNETENVKSQGEQPEQATEEVNVETVIVSDIKDTEEVPMESEAVKEAVAVMEAEAVMDEEPIKAAETVKESEVINETEAVKEEELVKETDIVKGTEAVNEVENIKKAETVKEETSADIPIEAVIVGATAAVASATAVGAKIVSSPSKTKSETTKKPLSKTTAATAKPKVAATTVAKKPTDTAKKPVGVTAKPRTVPPKPAGITADKKPVVKTTSTTTTTTARKPLSATTAKTNATTSATRTVTTAATKPTTTLKPTTAPRSVPSSTIAARKPPTANGPSAKPRPTTAPPKPTSLGIPATNGAPKTKTTSPRPFSTSQVRKTTPTTNAAKSPVKPIATNGVTKTASSTLTSRTKTTTTAVSSTTGTTSKTFTARPAPKFTSSSTATTTTTSTKRSTGGSTVSSTATTKTSSTPLRKSTPTKPATGRTPTKQATTPGSLKSKSPLTKTASPTDKPAPIRKPVDKNAAVINGDINANKELNGIAEEQCAKASIQNGDVQTVKLQQEQNGDFSIPMQTEKQEQSYLEPRDEQMPMDLINA